MDVQGYALATEYRAQQAERCGVVTGLRSVGYRVGDRGTIAAVCGPLWGSRMLEKEVPMV